MPLTDPLTPSDAFDSMVLLTRPVLASQKVPKGTTFRYSCKASKLVGVDELLQILQRKGPPPEEDHVARQRELLSDLAGFD